MAEEHSNPAPLGEITHGPSKFEQFLDRNQKKLILAILGLVVAVAAYIVIGGLQEQEDNSAGEALSAAHEAQSDSYDLAALREVMEDYADTPASGSAALLLAEEQWESQSREEAVATLREFLANEPDHPGRPTALMALGNHLLDLGQKEDALATYKELVDLPTGRFLAPFALLALGDLAKLAGDPDAAKAYYERARDDYPNNSLTIRQFVNSRIALLGVQPPTPIAAPPVPEPTPAPTGTPIPDPGTPFPELIPKPVPADSDPTPADDMPESSLESETGEPDSAGDDADPPAAEDADDDTAEDPSPAQP